MPSRPYRLHEGKAFKEMGFFFTFMIQKKKNVNINKEQQTLSWQALKLEKDNLLLPVNNLSFKGIFFLFFFFFFSVAHTNSQRERPTGWTLLPKDRGSERERRKKAHRTCRTLLEVKYKGKFITPPFTLLMKSPVFLTFLSYYKTLCINHIKMMSFITAWRFGLAIRCKAGKQKDVCLICFSPPLPVKKKVGYGH